MSRRGQTLRRARANAIVLAFVALGFYLGFIGIGALRSWLGNG